MEQAEAAGLDGVVVAPGADLVWLSGYRPTAITERLTLLVLAPSCRPRSSCPCSNDPMRRRPKVPGCESSTGLDGSDPYRRQQPAAAGRAVRHLRLRLGMHLLGLQRARRGPRYRALSESLPMLRAVKDAQRAGRLALAGEAADATYAEIVGLRFAGRRETEVAADLARLLREFGHEQVDFTVVGSGPNGANPHHEAGDRVIQPGDAVVLDFGGLMHGYGSDTTRTVSVGTPTRRGAEGARHRPGGPAGGFDAVRPGVPCQEIDRVARAVITEAGYGDQFIHRTGHGIGVTTHEPPYMVEGEQQALRPGMCFSIEPGIYLAGRFGVRIEDIVTVTEDGGRTAEQHRPPHPRRRVGLLRWSRHHPATSTAPRR